MVLHLTLMYLIKYQCAAQVKRPTSVCDYSTFFDITERSMYVHKTTAALNLTDVTGATTSNEVANPCNSNAAHSMLCYNMCHNFQRTC